MRWWCDISSSQNPAFQNATNVILQNATLAALVCAQDPNDPSNCTALCPNPDLAGIGVRIAFYLQSLTNTLLVVFSKRDSVPSTWAATILTGALVIAAMIQKRAQNITLHHAILTMNFATLSCISSLAVAPTLSIWRLTPHEYYKERFALDIHADADNRSQRMVSDAVDMIADGPKFKRAQNRQRIILALAVLTQVVLQWAWGVVLFVSPVYSQTNCSGQTALIFFLYRFTAAEINDSYMVVWVFWLLFSLGITMAMTVILALSSPVRARSWTARSTPASLVGTASSALSTPRPLYRQVYEAAAGAIPSLNDTAGLLIFGYNIVSVVLWSVYIISSEIQIQANCIFAGENSLSGFGQITALLLSLAPAWSLTVAVYRWPKMQRKLERRRLEAARRPLSLAHTMTPAREDSVIDIIVANPDFGHESGDCDHAAAEAAATATTALPTHERARPTAHHSLQSAMRGGRERSCARSASENVSGTGARTHSQGPGQGPRGGVRMRMPTYSLIDVHMPTSTSEEWNELATFPRGPNPHL